MKTEGRNLIQGRNWGGINIDLLKNQMGRVSQGTNGDRKVESHCSRIIYMIDLQIYLSCFVMSNFQQSYPLAGHSCYAEGFVWLSAGKGLSQNLDWHRLLES